MFIYVYQLCLAKYILNGNQCNTSHVSKSQNDDDKQFVFEFCILFTFSLLTYVNFYEYFFVSGEGVLLYFTCTIFFAQ